MTKAELISKLTEFADMSDTEAAHIYADDAVLEFINDEDITKAFNDVDKWYA